MKKLILLLVLAALAIWIYWGNRALMVQEIFVESERIPEGFRGFRIAQISDLHNTEFGENNEKLLAMLKDCRPDIIVITGDLVDSRHTDLEIGIQLGKAAAQIAPTYYVTGNHEARLSRCAELKAGLRQAGVVVLENEKAELERNGDKIRLFGMEDPSFHSDYMLPDSAVAESVLEDRMGREDTYTVLLSHRPELFELYTQYGVDLAFTGHAHGGQIRLPFVGGVVAPNQGLFPQYDAGLYTGGSTNMVVSRGLGNSILPLRVNNPPEIIVVQLGERKV